MTWGMKTTRRCKKAKTDANLEGLVQNIYSQKCATRFWLICPLGIAYQPFFGARGDHYELIYDLLPAKAPETWLEDDHFLLGIMVFARYSIDSVASLSTTGSLKRSGILSHKHILKVTTTTDSLDLHRM